MINIPKTIYLQIGESDIEPDYDFNELGEVCWCADKIFKNDIEYVITQETPEHLKPSIQVPQSDIDYFNNLKGNRIPESQLVEENKQQKVVIESAIKLLERAYRLNKDDMGFDIDVSEFIKENK